MYGLPHSDWNNLRKRIINMVVEDTTLVYANDRNCARIYEDATVQKFMRSLIHATGHENAYEVFCEACKNTIDDAVNTGIISKDEVRGRLKAKNKKRARRVSEDELSAPNSGMAG